MRRAVWIGGLLALLACGDGAPAPSPSSRPLTPNTAQSTPPAADVPALIRALLDGDAATRRRALATLRTLGPDAAPALPAVLPLVREGDGATQAAAREAIRATGPAALPGLLDALGAPTWQQRYPAVKMLCALGPAARAAARERLDDPAFTLGVVEFLLVDGDPAALDPGRLEPDLSSPAVEDRRRVMELLRFWPPERSAEILPLLRRGLGDEDETVLVVALDILNEMDGDDAASAAPELVEVLVEDRAGVSYRAVNVLRGIREIDLSPELLGTLGPMLRSEDEYRRDAAFDLLEKAGAAAVPALEEFLRSAPDGGPRGRAEKLLQKLREGR